MVLGLQNVTITPGRSTGASSAASRPAQRATTSTSSWVEGEKWIFDCTGVALSISGSPASAPATRPSSSGSGEVCVTPST